MDFDLNEQARQRVMDFLSFHSETPAAETADMSGACGVMAAEAPASIATQTAADLLQFLREARS